ncbi:MAG: SH3 domain-containing protein [Lachnospiraceae bacterium]|nr:SH3 domain-containing protein [Lachnospiraceae bacterium]
MNNKNDRAINFVRFFFLGLAIALLILFGVLVFSIYRSSTREITDSGLVIVDDTEAITQEELTEQLTEEMTEAQTEEAAEDLMETDASAAGADETDDDTVSDPDSTAAAASAAEGTTAETAAQTAQTAQSSETAAQTSDSSTDASAAQTVEGDVVVIDGDTAVSDDSSSESTGVYSTLNAACNFRSEAGYEDDEGNDTTISTVQAGTQVEVLEAVGGWTKVKIDGVVGYVGAQFVGDSDSDSE